ncbi:hypothetical protein B7463_g12558, partial [Scytalidium lignicola]
MRTESEPPTDEHVYPRPWALASITAALYLTMFLVSLDRTIIATAIPRITNTFKKIDDIGWYGTAFLLTSATFLLTFGRIYTFYSSKWVYLMALVIFELGSAVCGAAPSSTSFIIGRAISGMGTAGLASGAVVIITTNVPLSQRPVYMGFLMAMFGIASVVAPLMGGSLTYHVSWRWCFYINLPIGAVTILIVLFILKPSPPLHPSAAKTARGRLSQLDPLGGTLKGASAMKSGTMVAPLMLGLVIGTIIAGTFVSRLGYYTPFMYLCVVLLSIGSGLLTTFTTATNHEKWIGYQVLVGFSLGLGLQQSVVAVQTVLDKKDTEESHI